MCKLHSNTKKKKKIIRNITEPFGKEDTKCHTENTQMVPILVINKHKENESVEYVERLVLEVW